MQIIDCVQAMRKIHRLPRNEVSYLQDTHNHNLFAEDSSEEDERFDQEEDWPEHVQIIGEEEFFERFCE